MDLGRCDFLQLLWSSKWTILLQNPGNMKIKWCRDDKLWWKRRKWRIEVGKGAKICVSVGKGPGSKKKGCQKIDTGKVQIKVLRFIFEAFLVFGYLAADKRQDRHGGWGQVEGTEGEFFGSYWKEDLVLLDLQSLALSRGCFLFRLDQFQVKCSDFHSPLTLHNHLHSNKYLQFYNKAILLWFVTIKEGHSSCCKSKETNCEEYWMYRWLNWRRNEWFWKHDKLNIVIKRK